MELTPLPSNSLSDGSRSESTKEGSDLEQRYDVAIVQEERKVDQKDSRGDSEPKRNRDSRSYVCLLLSELLVVQIGVESRAVLEIPLERSGGDD